MHTKRYKPLTHALCVQAVFGAYDDKWFRRNYLADAEKYGGVAYGRLKAEAAREEMHAKLEIANGIALEMEQRVEDLLAGDAEDLDLDPVHTFPRIDGISMKTRELSDCCPMHQCFGHLAVLGLMPLFRAKLLPYQFASIPGRGQVALKRQVERWLRRKSLGIRYALKLDIKAAYPSTNHAVVMRILRHEIPGARWLLAVVECLLGMAPHGGLLIGGYLESWLFNLIASYLLRRVTSYGKTRRGVTAYLVQRGCTYMDDIALLGRRWASLQSAARQITVWTRENLGLTIKECWEKTEFLTVAEEHRRRHLDNAARGCPGLDMAGYVMHRTYTSIRRGIFKRLRRQYLRAGADLEERGSVPLFRAFKLVSYKGYFSNSRSRGAAETLDAQHLFNAARCVIAYAANTEGMRAA